MPDTFTEPPLSDEDWDEIETIADEALAGVFVEPEDTISLVFTRVDALALAEFLAYIAVTYGYLPMIAEQIVSAIADWEEENHAPGE